jgi:hypothetical protein
MQTLLRIKEFVAAVVVVVAAAAAVGRQSVMAQLVSCRPLTTELWVLCQASQCGKCGGHWYCDRFSSEHYCNEWERIRPSGMIIVIINFLSLCYLFYYC